MDLAPAEAAAADNAPTASSTAKYRHPIFALQLRQWPRSASQLMSGRFSHQASVRPQLRQCERGWATLSPAGQRLTHTFRKLPKASPRRPAKTVPGMRMIQRMSIRLGAGNVLLAYTLRDSFARGDRLYDMGVGSLASKRYFLTRRCADSSR